MSFLEFSRPITEYSNAKPMQSWITFDTQLKIALYLHCTSKQDLTERAIEIFKNIGRARAAKVLGVDLAQFYL